MAGRIPAGVGKLGTLKKSPALAVESWPLARLKPYEKNARKIPQAAVDAVARSIREHGFVQPIVVDTEGVIVIGHVRRLAAMRLELTEVPVVVCHLPPERIKTLRLADNRSHEYAGWDLPLLTAEMLELNGLNIDLGLTTFLPEQIQSLLLGVIPEWAGMPEFRQDNLTPWKSITVQFEKPEDRAAFAELLGQPITELTKSVWYPKVEKIRVVGEQHYASAEALGPRYPVYIVSKGRWEPRQTARTLDRLGVPYRIVVEPQERDSYAAAIDPAKILVLPFSNLGQGSIPARNWIWEHAVASGAERHWILDDNIQNFYRLHQNQKIVVADGTIFRAAEDFADRYTNVALAGFDYESLTPRRQGCEPFTANTRIYSCILIKNDLPYRWRGRYNEDTDLSLRVLKDGLCTVLFNAFLAKKVRTMVMKGGNTDELYQGDGRLKMAQSLQEQHPDCVRVTRKWNRWQHQVDYRKFRGNKFIPKPGVEIPTEANNYGMELEHLGT
jgi:ParB-like nuclease domain